MGSVAAVVDVRRVDAGRHLAWPVNRGNVHREVPATRPREVRGDVGMRRVHAGVDDPDGHALSGRLSPSTVRRRADGGHVPLPVGEWLGADDGRRHVANRRRPMRPRRSRGLRATVARRRIGAAYRGAPCRRCGWPRRRSLRLEARTSPRNDSLVVSTSAMPAGSLTSMTLPPAAATASRAAA